jgi:hypothetical protein
VSWVRVSKQSPCLACNHTDWCMNGDEGDAALCMRAHSSTPYALSSGEMAYIHKFNGTTSHKPRQYTPKPANKFINADSMFRGALSTTSAGEVSVLAGKLGVTDESLKQIGCAWFPRHKAWGFPMKDGNFKTVGIRLRCQSTGRKWSVSGSKSGIFCGSTNSVWRLFICEGPTDTAAAISCGLFGVGRPSCSSGLHEILQLIRTVRTIKEVVIISDNDGPGINGANELQKRLPIKSCILTLPAKDMRDFYKLGGNESLINDLIADTIWVNPER